MTKSKLETHSIYLIAPSGIPQDKLRSTNGINWLIKQGLKVLNTECLNRNFERFAGTDDQRLVEINSINKNTDLNSVVMSIRGGYGLNRLLSKIDWDSLAKASEKGVQIVGHSDFTALNIGLFAKTKAISLSGPMLSYDFGVENESEISRFTWDHFKNAISNRSIAINSNAKQIYLNDSFEIEEVKNSRLWGGNLSMLVGLIGTPYFPSLSLINNGILFIEDVNEHPYRIERMLWQLLESGILSTQAAVLFGDFSSYKLTSLDNGYDINQAIKRINQELQTRKSQTKILTGLALGHIRDKVTLPVGARASLFASPSGFTIKSSW